MNSTPSQWIFSLYLPFGLQYELIMQPRAQGRVLKTSHSLFKITYSVERVSGQDGTSASYQGSLSLVVLPFYPQINTLSWFLPFSGCYQRFRESPPSLNTINWATWIGSVSVRLGPPDPLSFSCLVQSQSIIT